MEHILIVEDDHNIRSMLKLMLQKKFNFSIAEASNGIEGLTQFQERKPDLILLDISMPLMNGTEFLEAIRADKNGKDVPVIVLTAVGGKELVAQVMEMGVSEYILKPFMKKDVLEKVRNIAFTRRKSKQLEQLEEEVEKKKESTTEKRPKLKEKKPKDTKILIVDKDPKFVEFFEDLFGKIFQVFTGTSGAESLNHYMKNLPDYMLLGDDLPLLNERKVVQKVREMDKDQKSRVFLCSEFKDLDKDLVALFDGVLRKSYKSEVFFKDFLQVVLEYKSFQPVMEGIFLSLKDDIMNEVRYHFGEKLGLDLTRLSDEQVATMSKDIYAAVDVVSSEVNSTATILLFGSYRAFNTDFTHAHSLSDNNKGVNANLTSNLKTLYKTVEKSLSERGIEVSARNFRVKTSIDDLGDMEFLYEGMFQTQYNARFSVAVDIPTDVV